MNKKINWKVRFKNKIFLSSFFGLIISFVFGMLRLLEVYPSFTENEIVNIVNQVLALLGILGIVTDPTTTGVYDSERAMTYSVPWVDEPDEASDAEETEDPEDQE